MIGLNPAFEPGGFIDDLVLDGMLHRDCRNIFRVGKTEEAPLGDPMRLHRHQVEAIRAAQAGRNYVLTTGTGLGQEPRLHRPDRRPRASQRQRARASRRSSSTR